MAGETAEIKRFLGKQPKLFEPDYAVSFRFLPYQEKLKLKSKTASDTTSKAGIRRGTSNSSKATSSTKTLT